MKKKKSLLASLPRGNTIRRLLWPVALGFLAMVTVLYGMVAIRPLFANMHIKTADLGNLRQSMLSTQASRERQLKALAEEVAELQEDVAESHNMFVSKLMAAQILDIVYSSAHLHDVRIVQMENHPSPKKSADSMYDIEVYRLEARGSFFALTSFLRQLERRIDQQAVLFQNLNMIEKDEEHALIVDLVLYSSPLAPVAYLNVGSPAQHAIQHSIHSELPESELWPALDMGVSLLVRPTNWPSTWPWPPTRYRRSD